MHDETGSASCSTSRALLRTTWFMAVVFWIGWAPGATVATVLFALISFFALREFITLSPTRRGDHRSLMLAFFVVLPIQFCWWRRATFDLFTVFIPVYVFLAIPVVSALADDPQPLPGAQRQAAVGHHGLRLRHEPRAGAAAARLPDYEEHGAFLVFFLVVVVQLRRWCSTAGGAGCARRPSRPTMSRSFHWRTWGSAWRRGVVGALLSFITPFKSGQALAMALIACVAGSMGHLVMKALKRDGGVRNWGSAASA